MSKRARTKKLEPAPTTVLDSGSLEFKIDYEKTKHFAIRNAVRFDTLSMGGHFWSIYFYPRGNTEANNGEYVSISIRCRSKSCSINAIFKVLVMDKHGRPSRTVAKQLVVQVGTNKKCWGWSKFMKGIDLEASYVIDGQVTFLVTILVLRDNPIPVPPSNIGKQLGKLLDGLDGTDVSFIINGETFLAHRAVLAARSPVFKAELSCLKADAKVSPITLHDIEPATFKILLQFMYTDSLPGDSRPGDSPPIEMFQNLLGAANHYALDRLKLICAQKLLDNVIVDTVVDSLACAEMCSCPELKSVCIDFLVADENFKKVVLTQGFVKLGQKFPSIIDEIRERVGMDPFPCIQTDI